MIRKIMHSMDIQINQSERTRLLLKELEKSLEAELSAKPLGEELTKKLLECYASIEDDGFVAGLKWGMRLAAECFYENYQKHAILWFTKGFFWSILQYVVDIKRFAATDGKCTEITVMESQRI